MHVGDYERIVDANTIAIAVDDEYVQDGGPCNFYLPYRIRNHQFLLHGAMFEGRCKLAFRTARELTKQIPEDILKEKVDFLDAFQPTVLHVMVRFGMWDKILEEPEPAEYRAMSRAIRLYVRALAYAVTDCLTEAEQEQRKFRVVRKKIPETSFLFQNSSLNTSRCGRCDARRRDCVLQRRI